MKITKSLPLFNALGVFMVLLGLAFVWGCTDPQKPKVSLVFDRAAPLHLGVFPFLEEEDLQRGFLPFAEYLSNKLERRVEILIVADYGDFERLIGQKRVEIGWFTPRSKSVADGVKMVPICRPIMKNLSFYHGLIIARRDENISSLEDLKGKSFAFVDRNSNSGFLYPNRLFKKHGIAPLTFFKSINFAGSHDRCLEGVLNRNFDAAAVTDLVVKKRIAVEGENCPIVVVATTSAILTDPIVVSDNLPENLRTQIKEIFLTLNSTETASQATDALSSILGITGFSEIETRPEEP